MTFLNRKNVLSGLMAILMMLSPIISSADALMLSQSHKSMMHSYSEAESKSTSKEATCHDGKTSHTNSVTASSALISEMDGADSDSCCDTPCFCTMAGCHSASASSLQQSIVIATSGTAFNFDSGFYLNPLKSLNSPPPIV